MNKITTCESKDTMATDGSSVSQVPIFQVTGDQSTDDVDVANRATTAGGNLLYSHVVNGGRTFSLYSQNSDISNFSAFSQTSAFSKVSEKVTESKTVVRRFTRRLSTWFGLPQKRSEDSIPHGLYSDVHFAQELPEVQKEMSGSMALKLTYTFMFFEWMIFCGVFIKFMTLLQCAMADSDDRDEQC